MAQWTKVFGSTSLVTLVRIPDSHRSGKRIYSKVVLWPPAPALTHMTHTHQSSGSGSGSICTGYITVERRPYVRLSTKSLLRFTSLNPHLVLTLILTRRLRLGDVTCRREDRTGTRTLGLMRQRRLSLQFRRLQKQRKKNT